MKHFDDYYLSLIANLMTRQDPDALLDPDEVVPIPQAEAAHRASTAFREVFANGPNIELDHYILYHSRKNNPVHIRHPYI
jgi:hypothetical protein